MHPVPILALFDLFFHYWLNHWLVCDLAQIKSNDLSEQAKRVFAAGAVLFDLGGNGAFWKKRV
jgi:hypothetical protein